jgi:acetyltransferase-like isoleucine patch superfamily enzyme
MILISTLYKAIRKMDQMIKAPLYTPIAKLQFYLNGIIVKKGLNVKGFVKAHVTRRGKVLIGENLSVNSGSNFNVIGRQQKTILWVEGELNIGDNVGMSATAIICNYKITIGNNVMIGGNTVIYDTDFHTLDASIRNDKTLDRNNAIKKEVTIGDNVFIGAHSTILKGVTIGNNAIIGACSVVTKSIPDNEIWAGNPARFIKETENAN